MLDKLINEESEKIAKTYKITVEDVKERLNNELEKNIKLLDIAANAKKENDIKRTKIFKDFIKKCRKSIYYDLRTYQTDSNQPIKSHISTQEREPHIKSFLEQLDPVISNSESVLDVGGGLFPLSIDFKKYNNIKNYTWIDRDKISYQKLLEYKKREGLNQLYLHNHKIGEEPWERYLPESKDVFDLVLLLKVVPVLNRQNISAIDNLLEIPGGVFLITGSKESMVKRCDIERRERKTIENFIKKSGKTIVDRLEINNEFGYFIK